MNGVKINIDGLDIEIVKIDIQQNYNSIRYANYSTQIPGNNSIKMIGLIANRDYIKFQNWFESILGRNQICSYSYKKNIIFNTIQIIGIMPIDYEFDHSGIRVSFSVDYICGDLNLFNLKKLRKEKLDKLNKLSLM